MHRKAVLGGRAVAGRCSVTHTVMPSTDQDVMTRTSKNCFLQQGHPTPQHRVRSAVGMVVLLEQRLEQSSKQFWS